MATKAKRPAPKTAKTKLWVHTFYLLQPFVQFVALVAVMFILARCSPLAPSTDRVNLNAPGPELSDLNPQAAATALEDSIQKNLKELNSAKAEVISETEMLKIADEAPHVDVAMSELGVKQIFTKTGLAGARKHRKVLYLPLTDEAQNALFRDGYLRLDLSDRLKNQTKEKPLKLLLKNLRASAEGKDLGAAAYFVMPDTTMQRVQNGLDALNLTLKVSLSVPSDDMAILEIRRVDLDSANAVDNAALLEAALEETHQLAIILE